MPKLVLSCLTVIAAALLSGCTGMSVNSDYDDSRDFSSYRTFSFISDHPLLMSQTAPVNPLFEGRVMTAIRDTLTAQGMRYVDDRKNADVVVSFTLGARDKIQVTSYPTAYRGAWGWGGSYHHENVDVRNYTQGTLAIDLFDVKKKSPVWHGWAVKTITSADYKNPTSTINNVIEAILAKYPPS
jgi:hypothetical protein